MNIFIVGWQAAAEDFDRVKSEFSNIQGLYPSLDPETTVFEKIMPDVFYGSLSHGADVAAPRKYLHRDQKNVVLYDGCLVDMQDGFPAHDASRLAKHWDDLPRRLEGQFAAVKINRISGKLQVMTDPLGTYQVYYLNRGSCWFVSNNLYLLCRFAGESALDPDGVSLFLATSGYGKDFTVFENIKVITAGQIWRWSKGRAYPAKHFYCRPEEFIFPKKKTFSESQLLDLAETLARPCKILARYFGSLEAPITAGKDSRFMTALLMHESIPAQYFSAGAPGQNDVRIGRLIANRFGLPHRVKAHDTALLSSGWDFLTRKFVTQTDGSVSLAHIANILDQPEHIENLGIHLYGIGGENARKSIDDRQFYLHRPTLSYLQEYMFGHIAGKKRRNLLKPVVYEHVRKYAYDVIKRFWDYGFPPLDVFKARSVFERSPRWSGPNFKQVMMSTDVFSPFCVRAFAEAAFQIHALRRYADYLHYRLIKTLNPELWAIELTVPWKTQHPLATMAGFIVHPLKQKLAIRSRLRKMLGKQKASPKGLDPGTRRFQRSSWLQTNLASVRSFCLDNTASEIWDFVDREEFERLTAEGQDEEVIRKRHKELYDTYTMFVFSGKVKESGQVKNVIPSEPFASAQGQVS